MSRKSGLSAIQLHAEIAQGKITYNLEISEQDQRQIFSYADRKVSPASEYRGFLRAMNLENRDGILVDAYADNKFHLQIPVEDILSKASVAVKPRSDVIGLAANAAKR
jgi:hypothetical protein